MRQKLKKVAFIAICVAAWAGLYRTFIWAEATVEPRMFSSGQETRWWSIVFLYWLLDTAMVLCCAYAFKRPFGFRMPKTFPFWQVGIDGAVLVFLVHLAWLCTDNRVYTTLASIGLYNLPFFLLIAAVLWSIAVATRFRALRTLYETGPHIQTTP